MNRRTFFQNFNSSSNGKNLAKREIKGLEYANKILPARGMVSAGLQAYTGPWTRIEAAHLLRRATFGPTNALINSTISAGMVSTLNTLLADLPAPAPPLNTNPLEPIINVGQTWVNAAYNGDFERSRTNSLKQWWVGQMISETLSLREKMTLFLHNNYVTRTEDVQDPRYSYKNNALLREYAFGDFKELSKKMCIDPAMLDYQNGNTNTGSSPNENFARELQELFTIGKGPELGPGNYTNYTEQDVQSAARVLSGWRNNRTTISSYFTLSRHDTNPKQFSSAYGNQIIDNPIPEEEYKTLVDMIFDQAETARFLARKLYRYFVYYVIDAATEISMIEPMAVIIRNNNYNLKPVLSALFQSQHFYDMLSIGCDIKSPVSYTIGFLRQFQVTMTSTPLLAKYETFGAIHELMSRMQQDLFDPPSVAGWAAYYQEPVYYQFWINSETMARRAEFSDVMVSDQGITIAGQNIKVDLLAFVSQVSDPSDPTILVDEVTQLLYPIPITQAQKDFLKNILIPGLPDFEWTIEWQAYASDPTNVAKKDAVLIKLRSFMKYACATAEYHLS